jgi:hypothetical protein
MLLTSQNRRSVHQGQAAFNRGRLLAMAVAHRDSHSKRCTSVMRRTGVPGGEPGRAATGREPARRAAGTEPVGRQPERMLRPSIWAQLVLSRAVRG